ncbi:uncharacterized protein BBA_07723 [Beauveria bassiana ARSEF 2860]|uniref:Uncharacterized protein n=1 Tax=Beauveria bassiana (strain ARSEF 2860) TaxID=655819 RepID=J4KM48_BEAB2|nr:uncharacterized protein BBA_07723 [Beauveria bassiana ARSEF 2860]EJP63329.1 hypothetical protein BBA_07723 [Beauveria bassiana ARSEF 2860]
MSTSMREHFVDAYTILHVTDQGEVIKVSLKEAVVYPQDLVRELSLQKEAEAEDDAVCKCLPFYHVSFTTMTRSRVQLRASPALQQLRPLRVS